MATAGDLALRTRARYHGPVARLRRSSDLGLAAVMGGIVAMFILRLPMEAALASAVVGAFVLIALVDTRVAVLALVLVRSTIDVTATVPLLSAAGSSNVNANALMSLLVLALGAGHVALNRIDIWRIPLVKPFVAFIAVTFLGIALSPDHVRSLQDWMRTAGALVLYILVVDLMQRKKDRRWLIRAILLSAVVPLAFGLYQAATDAGDHDTAGFNRIYGTLVHPSPYGFYLLQLLPLALFFFLHTRNRVARVGLVVMIPVMAYSIYATQTRGAWIGLGVMVMVFMWTRARWSLLLVPLVAGAMVLGLPSMRARLSGLDSGTCESAQYCQSSLLWRQKQWEDAVRIASPAQLATVGAGLGAVDTVTGNATHQEYVRLLVEAGLLGLAAMVVLYLGLFKLALAAYRGADSPYRRDLALAFLMVLFSRVVIAAADNIIIIVVLEWYFWAFAGLIVVESGAYRRAPRAESPEPATRHVADVTAVTP